jgi:HK97 family phage portal protein
MALFGLIGGKREERASLENPNTPLTAASLFDWGGRSETGIKVTEGSALTVPAVWAAVNFLSGTMASLPIHVFRRTETGSERAERQLERVLNEFSSDNETSYDWRKYSFDRVFTYGRAFSVIERNRRGEVVNIHPVDPRKVSVREEPGVNQVGKRRLYFYDGRAQPYPSSSIIETTWFRDRDFVSHYSPIDVARDTIGLAIAASKYGSKAFQNGGIPPVVMQGPFQSGAAAGRASDDVANTMAKLARDGRPVMAMPLGHELKPIGFNPEQMQLVELKRFIIEEIARIYSLPPSFLQDLSHGTFSNVEQQDLHFVKHTLAKWVRQYEQELTLKLFGRNSDTYVKMNVDGLLRGDLKTRMEAHATAIQNGIRTPNEARDIEDLEPLPGGDSLMVQGATVPLDGQTSPQEGVQDES